MVQQQKVDTRTMQYQKSWHKYDATLKKMMQLQCKLTQTWDKSDRVMQIWCKIHHHDTNWCQLKYVLVHVETDGTTMMQISMPLILS